jgi:flagella basal body P-ring formation protein FlgA
MKLLLIFSFSLLFANINQKIINFYKSFYPDIKIIKISSSPTLPKHYKKIKLFLNPKLSSGLIRVDNKYYSIKIKAKIPAFVAIKTIKVNEYIAPNVEKKYITFKTFYSPLVKDVKNLVATKIISKNEPITKNNSKPAPDIFKNQNVEVIINSNAIEIISSAIALENGNIGEFIKIKLNGKILNAKVIKKGVVEIE